VPFSSAVGEAQVSDVLCGAAGVGFRVGLIETGPTVVP